MAIELKKESSKFNFEGRNIGKVKVTIKISMTHHSTKKSNPFEIFICWLFGWMLGFQINCPYAMRIHFGKVFEETLRAIGKVN